jgi:hypothetical protein
MAYIGIEEKRYGLLTIKSGTEKQSYEWQHEGLDFETRKAIKAAVQVKEGNKPPQLVTMPVFISAEQGGVK